MQIRFYIKPGIISVFSPEQLLFIYIRLQFALQFGLFSISIGFYQSPCGRCWLFWHFSIYKITVKQNQIKAKPHFKPIIFSMYRRPIIDFKHGLSACSNVYAAECCKMLFYLGIFVLRIKFQLDLVAAGRNPVSTMCFVFVSCLFSSVHFICMRILFIAVHLSNS